MHTKIECGTAIVVWYDEIEVVLKLEDGIEIRITANKREGKRRTGTSGTRGVESC